MPGQLFCKLQENVVYIQAAEFLDDEESVPAPVSMASLQLFQELSEGAEARTNNGVVRVRHQHCSKSMSWTICTFMPDFELVSAQVDFISCCFGRRLCASVSFVRDFLL